MIAEIAGVEGELRLLGGGRPVQRGAQGFLGVHGIVLGELGGGDVEQRLAVALVGHDLEEEHAQAGVTQVGRGAVRENAEPDGELALDEELVAEGLWEIGRGRVGSQEGEVVPQKILVRGERDVGDVAGAQPRAGLGFARRAENFRGGAEAREVFPIEGAEGLEPAVVADAGGG